MFGSLTNEIDELNNTYWEVSSKSKRITIFKKFDVNASLKVEDINTAINEHPNSSYHFYRKI
jgi:hypothetical protein